MSQPENPETLAQEAEELCLKVRTLIGTFHAMATQQALLSKGQFLQAIATMLKRFDGIDLTQHELQRLNNQLAGLKPKLQKLRGQTGRQQPGIKPRQSQRQISSSKLNVKAQRPIAPRRPK